MPVKKGLATWAGLVAAVGQYAAAVAVFLAAPDPNVALGPLATATVTLYGVVKGRMDQATAHAARTPAPFTAYGSPAPSATGVVSWGTASGTLRAVPGEFDREPVPAPRHEQRELPDCA